MHQARGGPKRYVLIEEPELNRGKSKLSGGKAEQAAGSSPGYATVEQLQSTVKEHTPGRAGIAPPRGAVKRPRRALVRIQWKPLSGDALRLAVLAGILLLVNVACWFAVSPPWPAVGAESASAPRLEPEGDRLSLPRECVLARLGVENDQPFVLFDGHYPSSWPAGLKLPFGFFNQGKGRLGASTAKPGDAASDALRRIEFRGVVRSSPQELVSYFRKAIGEAGLELVGDQRSNAKELPGVGLDPGRIALTAKLPGQNGAYPHFYVRVALLEDMGGWAYCTGYWLYQDADGTAADELTQLMPDPGEVLDAGAVRLRDEALAGGRAIAANCGA